MLPLKVTTPASLSPLSSPPSFDAKNQPTFWAVPFRRSERAARFGRILLRTAFRHRSCGSCGDRLSSCGLSLRPCQLSRHDSRQLGHQRDRHRVADLLVDLCKRESSRNREPGVLVALEPAHSLGVSFRIPQRSLITGWLWPPSPMFAMSVKHIPDMFSRT